jgi:hypothetical protein
MLPDWAVAIFEPAADVLDVFVAQADGTTDATTSRIII